MAVKDGDRFIKAAAKNALVEAVASTREELRFCLLALARPSSALLSPFLGEGSPTKNRPREKVRSLVPTSLKDLG